MRQSIAAFDFRDDLRIASAKFTYQVDVRTAVGEGQGIVTDAHFAADVDRPAVLFGKGRKRKRTIDADCLVLPHDPTVKYPHGDRTCLPADDLHQDCVEIDANEIADLKQVYYEVRIKTESF